MTERRKPLTPAPEGACTHPAHLSAWVRQPGRSELLVCFGCRRVKESASPWREASLEELDAIHRLYLEKSEAYAEYSTSAWPRGADPRLAELARLANEGARLARPVNRPLETTMNRYAVASKGRGLTAIIAVPGWMDRQQALNLVAWLSVIAELKDEEILAARRQVEAT